MNFGSKLNRVKQQADRLFLRGDKTDVVGELRYAEEKVEELRLLCDAFARSLEKSLNTHSVIEEKKHRKVPENQAAEILKEALRETSQDQTVEDNERSLFKSTIEEIVAAEQLLGKGVLDYEEQVENEVLTPLYKLLKEDFPLIAKQKKALKQAGVDVDAARARLRGQTTSSQHHSAPTLSSSTPSSSQGKIEAYREELDEAESRLDQIRDNYASDLFAVLGRQREMTRLSNLYLELKADQLQKALQALQAVLPPIRNVLAVSPVGPVYGVPLGEHLRICQQEIAVPIRACIKRLVSRGLFEEGLLRVAGGATKVRRLKGLIDAGLVLPSSSLPEDEDDVHVIAGAFKSYLRELPEPLVTLAVRQPLLEAARKPEHQDRLRSLWQAVNALPPPHFANLRYVVRFLDLVAQNADENKMTTANLAIVMAPTLMGAPLTTDGDVGARAAALCAEERAVAEALIEYADYLFKGEVDFGAVPQRPMPPSPRPAVNGVRPLSGHRRTPSDAAQENQKEGTVESPKQPHRMKRSKPQAPRPPQETGGRASPEPTPIFSNNAPSPAPRLHHTSSVRRPTAEPPKPPGAPAKPPRPIPPAQAMPPTPMPRELISDEPPIGFEAVSETQFPTDEEPASPTSSASASIGFALDGGADEDEVQLRKHSPREDADFRKSLEGVLRQQPAQRHLVRPVHAGDAEGTNINTGTAEATPLVPVPAVRAAKEAAAVAVEKQDVNARCDKPALPEKPKWAGGAAALSRSSEAVLGSTDETGNGVVGLSAGSSSLGRPCKPPKPAAMSRSAETVCVSSEEEAPSSKDPLVSSIGVKADSTTHL